MKNIKRIKDIKRVITFDDLFRGVFTDMDWEYELVNRDVYSCADMYFGIDFIKECLFKGLKNEQACDYYWEGLKTLEEKLEDENNRVVIEEIK